MRKVTTCYGEFYIEGAIATSCTDDKYYYELPHADMTNDEIKDYFEILWENEHEEVEIETEICGRELH